jgi:pimeloyl-ACP methyl ester carboxylesterase
MADRLFDPPPATHDDRVAWVVELDGLFTGPLFPVDPATSTAVADAEVHRCWYPESGHGTAVAVSPSRLDRLGEIATRTLVVHGTADPVFTVEHALALAEGIPDSELWLVEGLGHEVPDACLADLLPRLLVHLARQPS